MLDTDLLLYYKSCLSVLVLSVAVLVLVINNTKKRARARVPVTFGDLSTSTN